jgi:hypothetical protein
MLTNAERHRDDVREKDIPACDFRLKELNDRITENLEKKHRVQRKSKVKRVFF